MHKEKELSNLIFGTSGVARVRPNAWLHVSGPDATAFLQGQCTQDLRPLRPGQTTEALWLNTKGRILGESLILRESDEIWRLWSAHTSGDALRARLEDFIIADDVTVVAEESGWDQITLAGARAENWLRESLGTAEAPAPGAWLPLGNGFVFAGRRGLPKIWEWLRPRHDVAGSAPLPPFDALGELSATALHRARIAAGVPAIPGEFGPQDLPQEARLESVAISFNKGCYLGQEVMARLHAMGQVRRRLLRVGGVGPAPGVNVELRQNDKRAGELRAVVDDGRGGWLGLALLNLLGLDPAASIVTADHHAVHILEALQP